jgi:hypothetical protein
MVVVFSGKPLKINSMANKLAQNGEPEGALP